MKTCDETYAPLVREALVPLLGSSVALTPIPTYPDSIVFQAGSGDRSVVFKAIHPHGRDPDGIGLEAWSIERAREAGVPAPRVLAVDTSGAKFPSAYFVMETVEGVPLGDLTLEPDQLRIVFHRLGEDLRALHDIALPGFGFLDEAHFRATGLIRGFSDTWRHALLDEIPTSLEYLVRAGALTDGEVSEASAVLASGEPILEAFSDPRLLHGDMGLGHVRADPSTLEVTALIDFGERSAGDPAYDFEDFEPVHLTEVLRGYGVDDEGFRARIAFYALARSIPWARKWHERGEVEVLHRLRYVLGQARS